MKSETQSAHTPAPCWACKDNKDHAVDCVCRCHAPMNHTPTPWLSKIPDFIGGIDPLTLTTEHLIERVQFELDLFAEGEPECDIKTQAQAEKARAFLEAIAKAEPAA